MLAQSIYLILAEKKSSNLIIDELTSIEKSSSKTVLAADDSFSLLYDFIWIIVIKYKRELTNRWMR